MKKVFMLVMAGLALALVGIQFVPYGRAHSNPPVVAEPSWDNPQTRELFMRACADCHSHQTVWPWYSHVAPVSWLVQRDVDEGRSKLNLSLWGQAEQEADHIQEVIQNGSMPPRIYLPTHPEARLAPSEKDALVLGLTRSLGLTEEEHD